MKDLSLRGWKRGDDTGALLTREWLVTNGLGGYASGTIAGVVTRRFHGVLIAALPSPLGRCMMLNHLEERIVIDGVTKHLSGDEPVLGDVRFPDVALLEEFRLDFGVPVWIFDDKRVRITKRLVMTHLRNTTFINYELDASSPPVELLLRPSVHFRGHEHDVTAEFASPYDVHAEDGRIEISARDMPPLRIAVQGGKAVLDGDACVIPELLYRIEQSRGYKHAGALWTPGTLRIPLAPGATVTVICSAESWEALDGLSREDAFASERKRREHLLERANIDGVPQSEESSATLVLAADQFIIVPETRRADLLRARASGEEPRTIIAGYHWFTDWGRDTMISLDGLTLATGRHREAASILRMFAAHVRDGLIPNMFPEGENDGLYHTADATLWFFHAVQRYVEASGDRQMLRQLVPVLDDIIEHHLRGTRFGIGVDPSDGLLRQGEEGYQLTWMDAKVDGWVVTPRRGKAVEINALFYNALMLLASWSDESRAKELHAHADRVRESFNARFWYAEGDYLYDVIDADDSALRPNQIFSIALDHPVLDRARWERVVTVVRDELLTPVGLRSLSRGHPDYKPTYHGDLRTRDAAYHQGTVWSWLIGPFIDAWLKVHPADRDGAREMLRGLEEHLHEACVGSVSEVFDAEPPYTPRGCIAQAWGVAELLRCLKKVAE